MKNIVYDKNGAAPCKFCKTKETVYYPKIVQVDDLYYAQCSNCKCHRSNPYEYLGTTVKNSIYNWNRTMEGRQNELL